MQFSKRASIQYIFIKKKKKSCPYHFAWNIFLVLIKASQTSFKK